MTKFINHKFLFKVRPFTIAKTTDAYDHLKPTLRDSNYSLFVIHLGPNDLPLNKISNEVGQEIINLAESVKKNQLKHRNR